MKKTVYIGIAVVGLALASCSKEQIQPTTSDTAVPTWKANTNGNENFNDPNTGGSNEGGITDPEHNEEQSQNNDGL